MKAKLVRLQTHIAGKEPITCEAKTIVFIHHWPVDSYKPALLPSLCSVCTWRVSAQLCDAIQIKCSSLVHTGVDAGCNAQHSME